MKTDLLHILDANIFLFGSSKLRTSNSHVVETLDLVVTDLRQMQRCLREKTQIMLFAGMTNVGKSTLLNALLGSKIAPNRNRAWSALPVEYSYSENRQVILSSNGDYRKQIRDCCTDDELLAILTEFATEGGHNKADAKLLVRCPLELLRSGIIIADTPGFGATDGSGDNGLHDDILRQYLSDTAQYQRISWIVRDTGMTESELDFFNQNLRENCHDIVVNIRGDNPNAEYMDEFKKCYRAKAGSRLKFHFLNAKNAILAQQNRDSQALQASGLPVFREVIRQQGYGKEEEIVQQLTDLYREFQQHVKDYLHCHNFILTPAPTSVVHKMLREYGNSTLLTQFERLRAIFKSGRTQ